MAVSADMLSNCIIIIIIIDWRRNYPRLKDSKISVDNSSKLKVVTGPGSHQLLFPFSEFKRMALGLLDQCFQTNEELTQQLLTYNLESWGGQSCLSLAVAIEHEEFLAHVSCQTLLTEIWTGAMKSAHRSSIKVTVKFPSCTRNSKWYFPLRYVCSISAASAERGCNSCLNG